MMINIIKKLTDSNVENPLTNHYNIKPFTKRETVS